jgi:phenylpyruvate tautomerase PptA (4-oxalocrotonate tautomerase family)
MPLYEFEHVIRLVASQKTALAKAVTDWHATSFRAPRFIVACRFIDVSQGPLSETFVGGESKKTNRLFVSLRSGTGRTPEQLEVMTNNLVDIWTGIVGSTTEAQLKAVYIKGTLDTALEGGFFLPMVRIMHFSNLSLICFNSLEGLNNGSRTIQRSSKNWRRLGMMTLLAW